MTNTLISFGLAIGWMDICGAICFQLLVAFMLLRMKPENAAYYDPAFGKYSRKNIFISYLVLLNAWIIVSALMMYGIMSHNRHLMKPWLIWCSSSLVLDGIFMLWWLTEMIVGDVIDGVTNILISFLTMSIEILFISVIYTIYANMETNQIPKDLAYFF